MKKIEAFENADRSRSLGEQNINSTVYWAYKNAQEAGNELLDFNEVIWDYDIDSILKNCKTLGITEFTISSTFSSLITTLAEFDKRGCHMAGLIQVKARYSDWQTGEHASIPAIKLTIKEA